MNLTTAYFAAFVLVVVVGYYALPRRPQNVLLLAASYVFYVTWSWRAALLLGALTAFNFLLARRLGDGGSAVRRRLAIGVGIDLAALAAFKWADFFWPDLTAALARFGVPEPGPGLRIAVPVGLSFYTLQCISYLVDVSRRQLPPADDFVAFALYLSWFPKLTAGPIERPRSFLRILESPRVVDSEVLGRSLARIALGLFRKLVLANWLFAAVPADAFAPGGASSSLEALTWILATVFGVYTDFAGYTDLARGVSGLFGIALSRNFDGPFFSASYSEIWDRWHITLSQWLRDYVYFPLSRALVRRSGSRNHVANLVVPPIVTMVVSGLWHGAGWGFVLWGALMGALLVVDRLRRWGPVPLPPAKRPAWRRVAAPVVIAGTSIVCTVPFFAGAAGTIPFWRVLFGGGLAGPVPGVYALMGTSLAIDAIQSATGDEVAFRRWPHTVRGALLALAILCIVVAAERGGPPFVYQGF